MLPLRRAPRHCIDRLLDSHAAIPVPLGTRGRPRISAILNEHVNEFFPGGQQMPTFDELKNKYQSVLEIVQTRQVHMANLHLENGKLLMKGTAPSQEAANAVWDEIKRVNPKMDDIVADFPVDPNAKGSAERTYTVKAGDTLSKISKEFYGNANDFMKIFEANRDKLKDPNKIQPGQELRIPAA
jgi:LysM repeat protein